MKNLKNCRKCDNAFPATDEYFGKQKRNKDGLQSYCRECMYTEMRKSKLKNSTSLVAADGCLSEKDHFNKALQHYAKIFDCPALLKHVVN